MRAYQGDLPRFVAWFEQANTRPMTPAQVTPPDVREYKGYLQDTMKQSR